MYVYGFDYLATCSYHEAICRNFPKTRDTHRELNWYMPTSPVSLFHCEYESQQRRFSTVRMTVFPRVATRSCRHISRAWRNYTCTYYRVHARYIPYARFTHPSREIGRNVGHIHRFNPSYGQGTRQLFFFNLAGVDSYRTGLLLCRLCWSRLSYTWPRSQTRESIPLRHVCDLSPQSRDSPSFVCQFPRINSPQPSSRSRC